MANAAAINEAPDIEAEGQTQNWPAANVEFVELSKLSMRQNNARTHSAEQIQQLADAINQWGWTTPILVSEDMVIIAGHGRLAAAELLSIDEVPIMIASGWSDEQIRAYVIADNQLALNAGWDETILAAELSDLKELDFCVDVIGFSDDELAALIPIDQKYHTGPDDVPDAPTEPVTKPGDIWQLGKHRLICGDATDPETYRRLLEGGQADLCWTDPPYNVNYQSKAGKIENDNLADDDFLAFLKTSFGCIHDAVKPGASIYVAHADTEGLNFRSAFDAAGFKLSGVLIWEKNALVLGRSDYQWRHEPILYGWKPGAKHRWFGGRKQTTVVELDGSVFRKNGDGSITVRVGAETIVIEGDNLVARPIEPSIIRVDKPSRSADHPTMKPVELIERMMRNSSANGDVVLDPFGGSGSTLIVCEMLGRSARLIELDPSYCDVIVRRWEEFAGKQAEKRS